MVNGLRSSWLTSAANRASRSTRCASAVTMALKLSTRPASSPSRSAASLVSKLPAASRRAAELTARSGAVSRRLAHHPIAAPATVAAAAAAIRTLRKTERVRSSGASSNTWK